MWQSHLSGRFRPVLLVCGATLAVLAVCTLCHRNGLCDQAVLAQADPTPTSTPPGPLLPAERLHPYDPPAPPDLALPASAQAVLGADTDGYPKIVKLWGGYDPQIGIDFYAQYDVIISDAFNDRQLQYLRGRNPRLRILYSGIGTYDLDNGPLGSQWIDASYSTPEFNCFYRGTDHQVLKVAYWNHGMFNMGDEWCRQQIVDYLVSQVGSKIGQVYDGVFFDRINQAITPYILDRIDLDHDGRVDNRDTVNELYWRGTEHFLDQIRQQLGEDVILVANDAPLVYASRLNGREYESFLRDILDREKSWTRFRYDYEQWMQASRDPRLTMVMSNPPKWMETKYGLPPWERMRGAVLEEAAAYYQRMRFGLATALMEGGLYSFEFGTTWHGNAWWYDEYDGAGLGKGYLGAPLEEAYLALGPLTTTNVVHNPGFEGSELAPWALYSQGGRASLTRTPVSAPFPTTLTAQVVISASSSLGDVRVEQAGLALLSNKAYTFSFWGQASAQLWDVQSSLHASGQPDIRYGLEETLKLGTTWQQYQVPFTATTTVSNAVLSLSVGGRAGTVWIDNVRLQQGALPAVYRRDFEQGIAICNASRHQLNIPLGATYCKMSGTQAPRTKIVIDDSETTTETFVKIGGWAGHGASDAYYNDCWGETYHHALTTSDPNGILSSATWQPRVIDAGQYAIFAWAVPHFKYNDTVTYTIHHAGGTTQVPINPRVEAPTWLNLGIYTLGEGTGSSVTLNNFSQSTWVVVDAVKFESVARYNSGECVDSITLQGQDGIVLLNRPLYNAYLPLVYTP
jgi:hypothetical protein